jgi:type VI secretion system secreted protein Hcp
MSNNMFLKFEGGPVTIEGETKDSDHLTQVDIESFSWGAYHAASFQHGTGGSTQAPSATEFNFMKRVDSSSAALFQALCDAAHITTVTLEIIKTSSGGTKFPFYKLELSPVMVTAFQSSGSGDPFMESVTLAFGKASFKYKPQDQTGEPMAEKEHEHDFQASN